MTNHAILFSSRADLTQRSSGAHRIANHLRSHDWDVEVIDFAAHWPLDKLQELVKSRTTSSTVFFGFSIFFNHWNDTLTSLTSWMKQTYPDVATVLGGQSVAITQAPDANIDYWVDSFGEHAIVELAKNLTGNSSSKIFFDPAYFGKRKLIKSITAYPAYPMDSYRNVLEKRDYLEAHEWLTTEFSRGCKFSCAFCNFPILGVKGDHSRTQDDFEYEMKYNYDNYGIENYHVADETFNDRIDKIQKFADVVDNRLSFQPFFSSFMRADLLTLHPESWDPLIRLGMGGHYYGIETFNRKSAKIIGKGMNPEKIKAGLLDAKNYFKSKMFYRATISIIVGLPFESPETFAETENWLDANWQDQALVAFPLDVDDVSQANKKDKYTNVSEFSKNLIKYGIREMPSEKLNRTEDSIRWFYDWRDGGYHSDIFMWEHDDMNIIQAREISERLQFKQLRSYKMNNWVLDYPSISKSKKIPLKETEHLNIMMAGANKATQGRIFVDEYIEKKLNYRP